MKFNGACIGDCGIQCDCLVGVELFKEKCLATNIIGRMCPKCGIVHVVDLYGEIVTGNIPGLRMRIALFRNGILTGKIAYWDFMSGKFLMPEEINGEFPEGLLGVKLPFYRKGILSGGVFEAGISLKDGIIDRFKPYR